VTHSAPRPSALARAFGAAARGAAARPWRTLAVSGALVAALLVFAVIGLELRTSNLDLIDPDLPEVRGFLDFAAEFGTPNVLVVVLEATAESEAPRESEMPAALAEAVRRIGPRLRALPSARAVIDRLDEDPETLADLGIDVTDELLLSYDRRMAFVFVQPADAGARVATIEPMIDEVRAVLARARVEAGLDALGVTAGLTGLPQYALDDRDTIRRDVSRLSLLSLLAIAAVFAAGFHEVRRPALAVLAVLVAVAATAGVVAIVPGTLTGHLTGHLTLLSAFFAAILFGLGVDFGIHTITRTEDRVAAGEAERDAVAGAVADLAPALTTAAATTAAVFLSMLGSGFRGFAQLGLVAGIGIVLCLATTILVLPALLAATSRFARPRPRRTLLERVLPRAQSLWGAAVLGLLALGALLVGGPGFDSDYLALQPRGSEAVRLERAMVERSDLSPQFAAFVVDSADEARALVDRLLDDDTVGEVRSITDLDGLMDGEGRALEIPAAWRAALVSAAGRYAVYAYPEGDVWNPEVRDEFLAHMRAIDPAVTGMPFLGALMVERSRRAMTRTAVIGGAIVLLAVFLDLRRPLLVLLAVSPTVLTLIALHALMRLLGLTWNPIDVMALPVILGIAVDDGVHLVHGFLAEEGDLERTLAGAGRAVLLTSLTTLAGFGALALTAHRGLASFALVTVLGVGSSLVLSLFLLPAALALLAPGRRRLGRGRGRGRRLETLS
jgi:predicted RND superfamily exporter protein